jgi:hypothetical protein
MSFPKVPDATWKDASDIEKGLKTLTESVNNLNTTLKGGVVSQSGETVIPSQSDISNSGSILAALNKLVAISQNAPRIQVYNAQVTNIGIQVKYPSMFVPDGFVFIIESRWSNAGLITVAYMGEQDRTKVILPGQNIGMRIISTAQIVIYGTAIGDFVDLYGEFKTG